LETGVILHQQTGKPTFKSFQENKEQCDLKREGKAIQRDSAGMGKTEGHT